LIPNPNPSSNPSSNDFKPRRSEESGEKKSRVFSGGLDLFLPKKHLEIDRFCLGKDLDMVDV